MTRDWTLSGASRGASGPIRRFVRDGTLWTVHERGAREYDRRSAQLVFESDAAVRLVTEFPADWHALPDDELFQLSWRR
jgi:hypothetical protein